MAETIRQYLAEVEHRLRETVSDQALQDVLAETENHLRESAAEIESLGFGRYEAEQRAVLSFGEAEQYGKALEQVAPARIWAAPNSWMVALAGFSTFVVLLWPALVQQYDSWHASETFKCIALAAIPALGVPGVAFLGSRVRARLLFLMALAGGVLLVPILASRFVGSMNMGGIVARSLQLRDSEVAQASWLEQTAHENRATLAKFNRLWAQLKGGEVPSYNTPVPGGVENMQFGRHYLIDVDDRGAWDFVYEVPQRSQRGLTQASDAFGTTMSLGDASKAWRDIGPAARQDLESNVETYTRWAREARQRLAEPFWYRAYTMSSWAPIFALAWGALLVLLQAIGTGLRRLALWLLQKAIPDLRPDRPASA